MILAIVSFVLGGWIIIESRNYDVFRFDPVGGGAFPRLMAYGMLVCGFFIGLQFFMERYRALKSGETRKEEWGKLGAVITMIICIALYLVLMPRIGYLVTTTVLCVALSHAQGERSLMRLVVVPACMAVSIYLIFAMGLGIRLPTGILI